MYKSKKQQVDLLSEVDLEKWVLDTDRDGWPGLDEYVRALPRYAYREKPEHDT